MLVLASASARRHELLLAAGISHLVRPAVIPEVRQNGETPLAMALRLAQEKATACAFHRPDEWLLAADTVVCCQEEVFGKPRDAVDAERMLRHLSGQTHQVLTAVCLRRPEQLWSAHAFTDVTFDEIEALEIRSYVQTGEPFDKAGAYAIQGWASRWVREIRGCYHNVVGLPVSLVWRMLRSYGMVDNG